MIHVNNATHNAGMVAAMRNAPHTALSIWQIRWQIRYMLRSSGMNDGLFHQGTHRQFKTLLFANIAGLAGGVKYADEKPHSKPGTESAQQAEKTDPGMPLGK